MNIENAKNYPASHTITVKYDGKIALPKPENEWYIIEKNGKFFISNGTNEVDISKLYE